MEKLLAIFWPRFSDIDSRDAFWGSLDRVQFSVRVFFLYLGVLLYGSFGFLDYLVGGEDRQEMMAWRGGSALAMLLWTIYFHKVKDRRLSDNNVIAAMLASCSVGVLGMLITASEPMVGALYPLGLIIILSFGASLFCMPAMHNAVLVWTVFIAYWLIAPMTAQPDLALPILLYFLTVGTLSITFGSFVRERLERIQYKLQIKLKASRDSAIEARRTQARFIASMSHELRTPLNAIIGFSDFMQSGQSGPISDTNKEYLAHINAAGHNLLANINDLLDLQRLASGKMSWEDNRFSLSSMMTRALALCETAGATEEVELILTEPGFDVELYADQGRMVQSLTNLITNACKFTDPGGSVTLSAEVRDTGDIAIAVTDTGAGISEEDLIRIQKPFEQAGDGVASKKKDGLGLGLAIVGGILEHVDGRLELTSELGVGTVATVVIPKARTFSEDHQPDAEAA